MSGLRSAFRAARIAMLGIAAWSVTCASAAAQETVSITVPAAVFFNVTDVSVSTNGAPSPMRVSFSNATLGSKSLRVSVQPDVAAFTTPNGSGTSIPASKVGWTIVEQHNGVGINGTLSSSSYALVFQSNPATPDGYVDLGWTLAAPGAGIRAGNHQLTIRWKLESISP
jgi:hypothetical protein